MKGIYHPKNDATLNPSSNESIHDVLARIDISRRRFIQASASASVLAALGGLTLSGLVNTVEAAPIPPSLGFGGIGFDSIPPAVVPLPDAVRVPAGYTAELFVAWGDPIMPGGVPFQSNAGNTAEQQSKQFGMHNDGMHFFGFPGRGGATNDRGILVINNEYTDENLLYPDGQNFPANYSIEKTRKSQHAHGVSVLEARRAAGKWGVVPSSPYGRRITANTPMRISGPAAGHALMKANGYTILPNSTVPTGALTDGFSVNGTINNCANGITPWGTYLTCEENWNGNFGANGAVPAVTTETGKNYNRYGVTAAGFAYNWHRNDPRFDIAANPNEPNLFGWVVEIDPFDPVSKPVKRTALGRFKHESVQYVVDTNNKVAFYQGDDERNEYIYKFVCAGSFNPTNRAANRDLLDAGTLYVAKFSSTPGANPDSFLGEWIALLPDTLGINGVALRDNPNFAGADDAEVLAKILIKTRMAADAVGATMMDRPEWTGARPRINGYNQVEVYCTLTNNNRRGTATASVNNPDGSTTAGAARPPVDTANPRFNNLYGHILRWREANASVLATSFDWDIFVQCGDTATSKTPGANYLGDINDAPDGSADFGAPDGLWFDYHGRLWVQTDQLGDAQGDWINIGANCMVCADPNTKEIRRFLTSPPNCEVTGVTLTPDSKTMFVGIQHPGEGATPASPMQSSNWPASQWVIRSDGVTPLPSGRPRSSVVVITRDDGGVIGA